MPLPPSAPHISQPPPPRFVGEVTRVDPTLLRSLVNSGYIPVVATVATDESGQALNVNADTAAGEVRTATHLTQFQNAIAAWPMLCPLGPASRLLLPPAVSVLPCICLAPAVPAWP